MKKIKEIADKKELNKLYSDIMRYEQTSMKDKVLNGIEEKHPELELDFDKIDFIIRDKKIKESIIIEGDYSYNFSVNF